MILSINLQTNNQNHYRYVQKIMKYIYLVVVKLHGIGQLLATWSLEDVVEGH
jgi:hypothetical protein